MSTVAETPQYNCSSKLRAERIFQQIRKLARVEHGTFCPVRYTLPVPAFEPPRPPETASSEPEVIDQFVRYLRDLERMADSLCENDRRALSGSAEIGLARADQLLALLLETIRQAGRSGDKARLRMLSDQRAQLRATVRRIRTKLQQPSIRLPRTRRAASQPGTRLVPWTIVVATTCLVLGVLATAKPKRASFLPQARQNTPPKIAGIKLTYDGSLLRARVTAQDAENDSLAILYGWTQDGRPVGGNFNTLSLRDFTRGSVIEVQVVAIDSAGARSPMSTATWTAMR